MGERPEPLVESLRETSCRAWKGFSNGSSLLPECRECPSFVLNALLETSGFLFKWSQNHWRLSNPANVLPNRSTNDFGGMLSPPSTQMPLSRLASDGWQTRGATMWRVRRYSATGKEEGQLVQPFFAIAQRICLNIPREGGHKIPRPSLWPPWSLQSSPPWGDERCALKKQWKPLLTWCAPRCSW